MKLLGSTQLRTAFIVMILITIPCYCVGGTLLLIRPTGPTPTSVAIALTHPAGTKTVASIPSITPIAISGIEPTLVDTPVDIILATATFPGGLPFPVVPSPGIADAGTHSAATAGLPVCSEISGGALSVVRVDTAGAVSGNIFCKRITNNNEIGIQDVINRGVNIAVEIFAFGSSGSAITHFNRSVKVCLQGSGAFIFLDASTSPRHATQLSATSEDGYTCATIPNAGTVVLTAR